MRTSIAILIADRDRHLAQISGWAATGSIDKIEEAELIAAEHRIYNNKKAEIFASPSAAGVSDAPLIESSISVVIEVIPEPNGLPNINTEINSAQNTFHTSMPTLPMNGSSELRRLSEDRDDYTLTDSEDHEFDLQSRESNGFSSANNRKNKMIFEPISSPYSTSSTSNEHKRIRRAPNDNWCAADTIMHISLTATQNRDAHELFMSVKHHFGENWKRVKGCGRHLDTDVYVNPHGVGYKKKNHPILGKDFFLTPWDAWMYCEKKLYACQTTA